MNDQAKRVSPPRRRFLRFSVRGMIVVVLLIGGWLGWFVWSARTQRQAVAAIEKTDGNTVLYDWQWKNGTNLVGGEPWAPKWLLQSLGIDYFNNVAAVCVVSPSEKQLIHVGELRRLQHLTLCEPDMSETSLAHLRGLTKLSQFHLLANHVTDADLAHLEQLTNLPNLSEIALACPQISGSGLAHLKRFRKLSILDLEGTAVTDSD